MLCCIRNCNAQLMGWNKGVFGNIQKSIKEKRELLQNIYDRG